MLFPFSIALFALSALAMTGSAIMAYRHRERSITAGACIVAGAALWLMMDAFEWSSDNLSIKLSFHMMRFVGVFLVPSGWLVLAMLISGYERYVKRYTIIALTVVPLLTLLLEFTDETRSLIFARASLNAADPYLPLSLTYGLGYWILVVSYSYGFLLIGLVIFVRRVIVSRRAYRSVSAELLAVATIPWALNVAFVFNPTLFGYYEPASFAISATGIVLLWRLSHLPLVNVVPVAHEILVDSLDEGIIVLDGLDCIVDANPNAQSLFGHSLLQAGGKPIEGVWAEWPVIRKALDSETGTAKEVTLGNGSEKQVYEVQSSIVEGLVANAPYRLIALRDITERKRMEEELRRHSEHLEELVDHRTRRLRESERELRSTKERLENVIAANPAVIYSSKALADHSDWHLTYISERVVTMLGYEPREFIGHPEFWERHVHPEDLPVTLAEISRLWKKGRHTFEYRFLHRDGTYRWIREEANVIRDADDKPMEVNGYWVDVTELKQMQEALVRAQRMAAIAELAAMVGHDLRNPLTGISGAAYYLKKTLGSVTDDRAKEMLTVIEKDVEYANGIMSDLVEYSGELRLTPTESSPRLIVEQALALVSVPRNVRVSNLTNNQPKIAADVEKMKRTFLNLIKNAVDAMPQGGELIITSSESEGNLQITVSDTGRGIKREDLPRIGAPFFTTKAKGMGLGMAISRRIVEAHGGSIRLESKEGGGTRVTVTVPIKAGSREVKTSE